MFNLEQSILILSDIESVHRKRDRSVPDKHVELMRARATVIEMSIIDHILNSHPQLEEDFKSIIDEVRNAFNQVKQ